jgi:hypothetical protein
VESVEKGVRLSHPYHSTATTTTHRRSGLLFFEKKDHMFDNRRILGACVFMNLLPNHFKKWYNNCKNRYFYYFEEISYESKN